MALPTKGRVLIHTTAGEIDVELWSKETPKACRNFIALALEGYYDGVIFHRVVPGFLVQTGDRTGTGGGGESFYGEPFEDEIHPRLRFAHRGLVGMANSGKKNTNDSQFFITLGIVRTELHGKHTLFGRVVGDTLYNVLKIGEMELGENERPLYPPKIQSITVVDNPFPDIIPRITAAEKRAQQRAREAAQKKREEAERRRELCRLTCFGVRRNVKLLSFADEEEGEQNTEPTGTKKEGYSAALTVVIDDPSLSAFPALDVLRPPSPPTKVAAPAEPEVSSKPEAESTVTRKSKQKSDIDVIKIREQHQHEKASQKDAQRSEIEKMEAEIRRLTRRREGGGDSEEEAERRKKKKPKSYLEEEVAKYAKGRGLQKRAKDGRRKDEGDVLAALKSFRGMLQAAGPADSNLVEDAEGVQGEGKVPVVNGEDSGMEVDDDRGFMNHVLQFPKDDGEETRKAERDYEVIDPRQRSAKAREEERERKRAAKGKNGHGRPRR
ncbi:cyclophilin-like domain-containing protein [Pisolithus albus]|nr:cyclophilin-like domain-containing protein [Pisolithus albus]